MTAVAEMIAHDRDVEIAKNAIKKGLSIQDISDITGLDESTIKTLQVEIDNE